MSETVILAIVAGVVTICVQIGTLFVAYLTNKNVKATHIAVNSRLSELLNLTATSSKAEGVKEEKERK